MRDDKTGNQIEGYVDVMECIAPDEISEEQLLAWVDGEGEDTILDHIRRCAYCAERVRILADDQIRLRLLFHRVECPDAHMLGEFHLGLLSASERASIEDHLLACPECAAEVSDLDRFLGDVPIAPAVVPVRHGLKHLMAHLVPPPGPGPTTQEPTLAFRGTAAVAPDFYQAEDIKVVVGLEVDGSRAGRKMLLGFTAREGKPLKSMAGAQVHLSRRGETVAMDQVDTLGNFVFDDLTSGEYQLVLFTDREEVVIEPIVL
jgi:hypothetical protein